jgi:hypothetical protein
LELCSMCCNQGQTMFTRFSTWRSSSVCLCGLPFQGWAIVALKHFHFTIAELTVDRSSSNRAKNVRTDLLERWHPMTVPCWNSLSSSVRPFYCQGLCMEIAWLCARFYIPVSKGEAEIAKSTNLKGCPHTFDYIVYFGFWWDTTVELNSWGMCKLYSSRTNRYNCRLPL